MFVALGVRELLAVCVPVNVGLRLGVAAVLPVLLTVSDGLGVVLAVPVLVSVGLNVEDDEAPLEKDAVAVPLRDPVRLPVAVRVPLLVTVADALTKVAVLEGVANAV